MTRDRDVCRRRVLGLAGTAATATVLAGCIGDDGDDGTTGDGDDDDGDDANGTTDGAAAEWADVSEIVLDGAFGGWEGAEPTPIEGEENPTLQLTAGREYEITWKNADGAPHNFEIRTAEDELLADTDDLREEGETLTLTVEATDEMAEYVCAYHPRRMRGSVEIRTG